ncbi:MAG: translation initiation factor IF-5A [Crenarchaeota archaeon]|nr:translation initiation factor IF-5A [Thermoproteota archaeon]MCR8453562.1 translation initiation factor IF-5A [Thermoproteota archaeon]MCR8454795.1 translation initiation factor IF-5A [Thermoproteota archaeon]MCR8462687.1 translation initiation factor IF-5A [Thermoproteota archaeon]MCR8470306.1 translation initiation factor IF-5A [Thermoproteota archaeon]
MSEEEITYKPVSALKTGTYIMIDGEPCKIVEISKSKLGKHGAAKARIVAVGVFTGQKRTIIKSTGDKIEVPIVARKEAQVLSIRGRYVELMDLETFEQFEAPVADDELLGKLQEGTMVEVWFMGGKPIITRARRTE